MEQLRPVDLPSPCYVVDEAAVERNLRIIDRVQREGGAKILLALKGFAMWGLFPLIRQHLYGVAASSLSEARLGHEHFGGEVHMYAPAYRDDQFGQILAICDHLSFNSFTQWDQFKSRMDGCTTRPKCAIRINPQHSEVQSAIYDPCAAYSRLGVTIDQFRERDPSGMTGLHFHTLCGSNADALERTLKEVEAKFSHWIGRSTWINFGGGHHISRSDYDVDLLIELLVDFKKRFGLDIYLEPGEAIALNAGVLIATILDVTYNEMAIAILDTSASAHMPDVLEMPYRPRITDAGGSGEKRYTYRLGGLSCLAGDVIGDYSFDEPLEIGQRLIFEDMAHYTMVKNTTFNGIDLPAIAIHHSGTGQTRLLRQFGYEDYKNRLS